MRDIMERLTLEYIQKYNTVLAHAFKIFKSKQEGAEIPLFMDLTSYDKAQRYVDTLYRMDAINGTKTIETMYERIMEGKV